MRIGRLNRRALRPLLTLLTFAAAPPACDMLPVASEPAGQAAAQTAPAMPGRTMLSESERKAAADSRLLPPGTLSVLRQGAMRHGNFAWNEERVPGGRMIVWVDLRRQMVSVFRGGHEIGTAVIQYGHPGYETPQGAFRILRKVADYHSRSYDAPMPHSLFITNTGVALHGSPTGARRATHGCVGLPVAFARQLFAAVKVGDRVTVVESNHLPAAPAAKQG